MASGFDLPNANGKVVKLRNSDNNVNDKTIEVDKVIVHDVYNKTTFPGDVEFPGAAVLQGKNLSPYSGFKNLIINGGFDVWQRGNGPFTNYKYGPDRWVCIRGSHNSSATSVGVDKRINHITSNTAGESILAQAIELNLVGYNAPFNVGKTFTISIRYNSSTTKIRPLMHFVDGVVGGNQIEIFSTTEYKGGNSVPETVSWTFTVSANCVSTNNCAVLNIIAESAASNIYVYSVQLEEGSVATPFENRPYGLELSLCQRYYEVGRVAVYNSASQVAVIGAGINFQTRKRVSPTLSQSVGYTVQNLDSTGFEFHRVTGDGLWINGYYTASAEL